MYRRLSPVVLFIVAVGAVTAPTYSDGPPPAHTGGFGEPTCHACHFDNPPSDPETVLALHGIPEEPVAYDSVLLTVRLDRAGVKAAGFQLTARFAAGVDSGRQAGTLRPVDETVQIVVSEPSSVQYASHSEAMMDSVASQREWRLEWIAPARASRVVFHVAANAANGDESEFGDHIVSGSLVAEVSAGAGSRTVDPTDIREGP